MEVLWPSNRERCLPLRLVDEKNSDDGYLGGLPPVGISPTYAEKRLHYFATLPFAKNPPFYISIFVVDLESLMLVRGVVNSLGYVDIQVHERANRSISHSAYDSTISPCSISVLPESNDWMMDDDGSQLVLPGHKIGGRPCLIRKNSDLLFSLDSLKDKEFFQVCQIDFPGTEDFAVSGNWPFADGIFSLFARPPFGEEDWAWYWDF